MNTIEKKTDTTFKLTKEVTTITEHSCTIDSLLAEKAAILENIDKLNLMVAEIDDVLIQAKSQGVISRDDLIASKSGGLH